MEGPKSDKKEKKSRKTKTIVFNNSQYQRKKIRDKKVL